MATQKNLDNAYMECAIAISKLSKAERKKVGAILVSSSGGIIAEGFNGTPKNFDNVCEYRLCIPDGIPPGPLVTKPEVLHAESNAISKVARSTNSSEGATLYLTMSPCFDCAKMIIQAGIKRVVYLEKYRITDGLDLLQKANLKIEQLDEVV